jgi:hypothetical protein
MLTLYVKEARLVAVKFYAFGSRYQTLTVTRQIALVCSADIEINPTIRKI